jgi:hypothetical protein
VGVKWSGGEKACVEGERERERERERWRGKAKKEVRGKRNKGRCVWVM